MFTFTVTGILAAFGFFWLIDRLSGRHKTEQEIADLVQEKISAHIDKQRGSLDEAWSLQLTPFDPERHAPHPGFFHLDVTIGSIVKLRFYTENHLDIPEQFGLARIESIEKDHCKISYDGRTWPIPHVFLAMAYELDRESEDSYGEAPRHPYRDDLNGDS